MPTLWLLLRRSIAAVAFSMACTPADLADVTRDCPGSLHRDGVGRCVAADPTTPSSTLSDVSVTPSDTSDVGQEDDSTSIDGPDADVSPHEPDADSATPSCASPESHVRISEVLPNPAGTDAGREFVELTGPPGARLEGLAIVPINGRDGLPYAEPLSLSGALNDEGLSLHGGADSPLPFLLQNGPDAVALVACDGTVIVDAVAYGLFAVEDAAYGEGRPAPAREGWSIARCPGGTDTGDNATDFSLAAPSPGTPNTGFEDRWRCEPCVPTQPGAVVINEVYPDPPGPDGNGEEEFVELFAPPGTPLDDLRLVVVDGFSGAPTLGPFHLAGAIGETGYWVIGGPSVREATMALPGTLQNGPDAIVVLDCADGAVDAVAYGDFGALTPAAGEGNPTEAPSGSPIGRAGGMDTDDNASDFIRLESPTPGEPNAL